MDGALLYTTEGDFIKKLTTWSGSSTIRYVHSWKEYLCVGADDGYSLTIFNAKHVTIFHVSKLIFNPEII